MTSTLAPVLSIAGSDSSGGAGIQADLKTMLANGVFGMTAIAALTAQNTTGVTMVTNTPPEMLAAQIDAVFEDIPPVAVKIGMVSSVELINVIADRLIAHGATNIVLDPVFIFGLEMDIAGAAVATVIAQMSSCIFVLYTLKRKKMRIPLTLVKPEREIGKRIVKIGFSPFLILASDSVIIIALNAVLQYYGGADYGDTLITAATIVQSYMLLITAPMLGVTGGSQPLISYNYGANRADRIRKTVLWVLMLCVFFTAVMFIISRVAPQYFVRIFTDNAEYRELSVWGIKVFTLMVVPLSLQYVFVDALTALGMTKLSLGMSVVRKVFYFSSTCFLPALFTAKDAFYAEPVADILAASVTSVVFFFVYRKYLKGSGRLGEIKL